jgi:uncharacterized protein
MTDTINVQTAPTFREGWVFLALTVAISSLIWTGLFFVDPADNPWAGGSGMSPTLLMLFLGGGAVPSILGLVFAFRRGGLAGCAELLGKVVPRLRDFRLLLLALVLPVAAAYSARLAGAALGAQLTEMNLSAIPQAAAMALAAGLMEEFGWRGTALPALRRRLSLPVAGLAVGLVWAVWHTVGGVWSVSLFFGEWFLVYYLTGIVGTMAGAGLTLAAIWDRADGRLFPVLAFHLAFSASANVVTPSAGDPAAVVLVASFFAAAHLVIGGLAIMWSRQRANQLGN